MGCWRSPSKGDCSAAGRGPTTRRRATAVPQRRPAMSSSSSNGTTVLKSFAELGSAIDLEQLPAGPSDPADSAAEMQDLQPRLDQPAADGQATASLAAAEASTAANPAPNLATLLAQLASMSSGLEAMARQDARAREQATIELAQYEALAAERREAERALAEARQVRATAEQMAAQAFTDELRVRAAEHVATARA